MMNKMMLQKNLLAKQLVLMNQNNKALTSMMMRSFYYPDANHHHINQEVCKVPSLLSHIAYCFGQAYH